MATPSQPQPGKDSDPKHYRIEFENEKVRVLRITYGPYGKSVMHAHPHSLASFLPMETSGSRMRTEGKKTSLRRRGRYYTSRLSSITRKTSATNRLKLSRSS